MPQLLRRRWLGDRVPGQRPDGADLARGPVVRPARRRCGGRGRRGPRAGGGRPARVVGVVGGVDDLPEMTRMLEDLGDEFLRDGRPARDVRRWCG
ncbi:hypothetical protein IAE22_31330 [Bacillus sp. S34]|nr:hypothetical protein [Bacillus sp. S34]